MAVTLARFDTPLVRDDGVTYRARACGREREDGLWEGWVEFESDAGAVLRSPRETTQPNRTDLEYWATGLTPVYLEGTLMRTLEPRTRAMAPGPWLEAPSYDRPAPARTAVPSIPAGDAVMDPYAVYANGPDHLAKMLRAMRGWHLRQIIRAYRLADERRVDLELLTDAELIDLILSRVAETAPRSRHRS